MKRFFGTIIIAISFVFVGSAQITDFTFTDSDGNSHNLYSYLSANKAVVINFFSTTCGNSCAFASDFQTLYQDYGSNSGGIKVIGLELSLVSNTDIQTWKTTEGASYPVCGGSTVQTYYITNFASIMGTTFTQVAVIIPNSSDPGSSTLAKKATGALGATDIQEIKTVLANNGFSVGIADQKTTPFSVSVYPNPVQDNCNVKVTLNRSEKVNINIYNLLGEVVKTNEYAGVSGLNLINLNTSGLEPGNYFAEIRSDDLAEVIKLQIVR